VRLGLFVQRCVHLLLHLGKVGRVGQVWVDFFDDRDHVNLVTLVHVAPEEADRTHQHG